MSRVMLFLFVVFYAGTGWAACENMALFHSEKGELDLPCVDLGTGKCFEAKLKLNVEALGDKILEFDLLSVDDTSQPVPSADASALTQTFDSGTFQLHVPAAVIDSTLDKFEVILRLHVMHGRQPYGLFFTIESIKPAVLPNVCQGSGLDDVIPDHPTGY